MITIRFWQEIAAPATERMKGLPKIPCELVIPGILKIAAVAIEEVDVNGQTNEVKAIADALTSNRIRFRLIGTADNLTDGAIVTLTVDVIEETREQPRE